MTDLMSKGALFNALASAQDKGEIFAIIQNFPTVEIIRCENCEYFRRMSDKFGDCENPRFAIHTIKSYPTMNTFDYCSCAERRKQNGK